MLTVPLPKRCFQTADYPNVATAELGKRIPIGYGTLTGLVPFEIDTTTGKYKILDQPIHEITKIKSATKDPLVVSLDYTEDLALAEFTLVTPAYLTNGLTYYFAVECDYSQSGSNYVSIKRNVSAYSAGTSYAIDDGDGWHADPDDYDLIFTVSGKLTGGSGETPLAQNTATDSTPEYSLNVDLNTVKAGQSFSPTATGFVTKVAVTVTKHGTLTSKHLRVKIYSNTTGTQLVPDGAWVDIPVSTPASAYLTIPERNENEVLECDVKAVDPELTKVADVLDDVVAHVMGKPHALLDATELANLDTDRTQDLKIYIDEETTFGDFVGKLEAGQMWKLVPLQDGTYGTIVYESGEPANTPHFRDHDFLSFKMEIDNSFLKQQVNVFYNQDETSRTVYPAASVSSDVAKFFYLNEESIDVETFLKDFAAADALADDYLARYEVPIIKVVFEVHGWALDLLPGRDKVKITRTRAAYTGGTLSGVLFRIIKLVKRPQTNVVEITAGIWAQSAT